MAFIDNIDINYSEPFLIKNLVFSFDNNLSTYDASLPVSTFNFDDSQKFQIYIEVALRKKINTHMNIRWSRTPYGI